MIFGSRNSELHLFHITPSLSGRLFMKMDQESRLWRLNPYELSREPHHISPNDPRVIHTTRSLLETELQCAICLDILRNTRTTKECLHRFCDDCISQFLRSGERKCPNCRTKLVSMRSLRPDPLFDNIIKTIFPHRQEMDQQQAALLAKIDKNPTVRRGRGRPHGSVPGTSRAETVQNDLESDDAPLVCIKLRPYVKKIRTEGHEGLLKKWEPAKRYIKVKGTAKGTLFTYIIHQTVCYFLKYKPPKINAPHEIKNPPSGKLKLPLK